MHSDLLTLNLMADCIIITIYYVSVLSAVVQSKLTFNLTHVFYSVTHFFVFIYSSLIFINPLADELSDMLNFYIRIIFQ